MRVEFEGVGDMATLVLENVPANVYESLRHLAAARQRSVSDETIGLLQQALGDDVVQSFPVSEWIASEEISAPCDLPLPGPGISTLACEGDAPLPDVIGFDEE